MTRYVRVCMKVTHNSCNLIFTHKESSMVPVNSVNTVILVTGLVTYSY